MRKRLILLLTALMMTVGATYGTDLVNITPRPAQMVRGTGELKLTAGMKVGYMKDLPKDMRAEITKFVASLNSVTSLKVKTKVGDGLVYVKYDANVPTEGYMLTVTADKVTVKASAPAGLFYAFQTFKKLLPAHVMAGVAGEKDVIYTLPVIDITDAPRYNYRGYMLDVSRHFFDVAQIKKMLDVMAMYKLNRFHWHLTDDQGWRLPVAKYPELTKKGATNRNILRTDFDEQRQWREGKDVVYGPYAYTIKELKEVVAYAKERHIEILPEVDMPGHMVAAIHAYPELSTDPESTIAKAAGIDLDSEPVSNNVASHFTHNIWNVGGVSRDVLDVSNPKVIRFAKDVVDVLAEIFPYEYIHIGGDECPTYAWEKSASCQALKKELGLPSDRALQTWFTRQIADYAAEKHGRKVMAWNELICSGGVDMEATRRINPTIMCWIGANHAANLSQQVGLKHVYTTYEGGYYINRTYRNYDKVGAGRDGSLSLTYNTNPPANDLCIGVQGTFWCEHVDRNKDLEYLTLPRLQAIAEHGWTPAGQMNYEDFMKRICADAELMDLAGYNYGRHQLVSDMNFRKPDPGKWYRLVTLAADERAGRVWEVLDSSSPLIGRYADNGAKANRLWSNVSETGNESQLFRFVENPDQPGRYAIVCKAVPNGSLALVPTSASAEGRWDYQPSGMNYGFVLDYAYHNTSAAKIQYAIRPVSGGNFLNFSKKGQGMAINVYGNPADGNGGVVAFIEQDD